MTECLSEPLAEVVDRFMMRAGISKKKYFGRYLTLAGEVWEDIFQNTLWVVKSVWMPTKRGTPYNYVEVPSDCLRLLSVAVEDKCNLIQPLFYNNQLNVISKPKTKNCGCSCDCGGLCADANSMVATTKLIFTINGVPYYEKKWTEYCKNGDILEYTETPVKKYNDIAGDGGDYNDDYNDDYSTVTAPFSDYEIVTVKSQRKICKLEVAECGCPIESEANEKALIGCCGCYINWNGRNKKKCCNQYFENVNNNQRGEVKLSECNNKIYYKPSHNCRYVTDKEIPDFLLVNYQSTGQQVGAETLVPKYARNLMYAEMDYGRKYINNSFSQTDKQMAYYKREDERNRMMAYFNPIDLEFISQVQDIQIKY